MEIEASVRPAYEQVSIGEICVAASPTQLAIHGLGSCIAILLYDPVAQVSGVSHVLLPFPPSGGASGSPGRFASTAVPALVRAMQGYGADPGRLVAKVAGGAQMFRYERPSRTETVGDRNLRATLDVLAGLEIPVVAQDTGGTHGRSIRVDAGEGCMQIRALRVEVRIL